MWRNFGGQARFCGVVSTVKCFEDNTQVKAALAEPGAGRVLVVDAGGELAIGSGSSSATLRKDGTIRIDGKDITIDGSGTIQVKASGDVVIKGSKVLEN